MPQNNKKYFVLIIIAIMFSLIAYSQASDIIPIINNYYNNTTSDNNHANLTNLEWSNSGHTFDTDISIYYNIFFNQFVAKINSIGNYSYLGLKNTPAYPSGTNTYTELYSADVPDGTSNFSRIRTTCKLGTGNCRVTTAVDGITNNIDSTFSTDGYYEIIFDNSTTYETFDMNISSISHTGYSGTGNNPLFVDANGLFFRNTSSQTDNTKVNKSGDNITGNLILSGIPSSVLSFDGVNDYVTIPDSSSLDSAFGSENFTLEAWVYPKDWVNYRGIINKRSSYYYSASPGGLFSDSNGIRAVVGTGIEEQTSNSVSYKPSLNEWHHIVGTADGSTLKLYVDGVLRGSTAITVNPPSNNDPLTIGSFFSSQRSFNGTIDEVRIWNRALSASEISNLYNGTYVNRTGLVLEMNMNEEQELTTYDSSGYDNHGTLINGTSWNYSYLPLKYNNDIYLNKTGTVMRK